MSIGPRHRSEKSAAPWIALLLSLLLHVPLLVLFGIYRPDPAEVLERTNFDATAEFSIDLVSEVEEPKIEDPVEKEELQIVWKLRRVLSGETMVRVAFLGFAFCAGVAALSSSAWLSSIGLLVGGACWVLALSLFNVTVQLSTPRWVVGRTLSIYQTAIFGGMAVGSWLWGIAAEAYGPTAALLGSGAALTVGAAIGLHLQVLVFGIEQCGVERQQAIDDGFTRVDLFVADRDILRPAVDLFCQRAEQAGVDLRVREVTAMFHVWMTRLIPEAARTRRELVGLLREVAEAAPATGSGGPGPV